MPISGMTGGKRQKRYLKGRDKTHMSEYNKSWWTKEGFAPKYLTGADIFYVDRHRFISILRSFYTHFLKDRDGVQTLDLGCGDGILTHELLKIDPGIRATLIDGSQDMIEQARKRLSDFKDTTFITSSFQEILNGKTHIDQYDLVISSQAIHHLKTDEKQALFKLIHSHLYDRGFFVNIDVVRTHSRGLEDWYLTLWREWIIKRQAETDAEEDFTNVIDLFKREGHYEYIDTLENQILAMKDAGFKDVECFYKHGIFVMYGGRK